MKDININRLVGKTLTKIEGSIDSEVIILTTLNGEKYRFCHHQDCCESVTVDDIEGDLNDLIGNPLLSAEEVTNSEDTFNSTHIDPKYDSFTWTFYKFATIKGYVTIKWLGISNGYYSEAVTLEKL